MLQEKGVALFGISADDAESHQAFIEKFSLPFPLLTDKGHKVMEKYGAYGEKMMYGKVKVGVIRSSVLIDPKGKVIKHWRKVADAAKHPEQVLKVMEDLGS